MTCQPPPSTHRGRPRRRDIDDRITEATLTLLDTQGYASLTLEAIARHAGITRPTIYRRWPNKAALVVGVLRSVAPPLEVSETDDALSDLAHLAVNFMVALSAASYGATVLAIHAEGRHDPQLAEQLQVSYLAPRADTLNRIIERGFAQGSISTTLSRDTVRDLLFGPLLYRWLVVGHPIDHRAAHDLVRATIPAIRPQEAAR